jgi:hypothetical protein
MCLELLDYVKFLGELALPYNNVHRKSVISNTQKSEQMSSHVRLSNKALLAFSLKS